MTEKLEDFSTACRFCLETKKVKSFLLTHFHFSCYLELTGEDLVEHHALPMTICIMCHREIYKFYDFRVRLKEQQRKLSDLLEKSENFIEIESMAERVPMIVTEEVVCDDIIYQVEIEEDQSKELKIATQETPKMLNNGKNTKIKSRKHIAYKQMQPNLSQNKRFVHQSPQNAPLIVKKSSRDNKMFVLNGNLNKKQGVQTENHQKIHEIQQKEIERCKIYKLEREIRDYNKFEL